MHLRILATLLLLTSCGRSADPAAREKELSYLRAVVPEDLLEFAHVEVPAIENIAIMGEGAAQHLGLHVFPGQKKLNGGIRAEVSVDYPCKQGDTVLYAWRFMVPKGFVSDAPKNRWWIIGQWHDQPDRARGESWDGFASKSPPVLLALGELQGKLGIGIAYGPDQSQKHGPIFIEPGKWHSIAVEIHWSQKADGKATFFLDDMTKPVATATGPNMHNDFQHFLKLGMYRHPEIETDNWIYVDDLKITKP
jgi:hypothetical protein